MLLPDTTTTYTKGQQAFIQQRAHSLLVKWCNKIILGGDPKAWIKLDPDNVYVRYAADRKSAWLKDKGFGDFKILAPGWSAAASFLKR